MGLKMSLARRLVILAVAVGPMLLKVFVLTKDSVPEVFSDCDGKGFADGAPDVSSVV